MLGEPTGDLEDKRDLQIRKLAEEIDVRTCLTSAPMGQIELIA